MQGMRTGAPGASRKSSSVPSVWFQIHPALTYTLVAAPVAVAERPGADSVPRLRLARLGPAFREPSDAPLINSDDHGLCERACSDPVPTLPAADPVKTDSQCNCYMRFSMHF
jgi:hypothetical protein